MTPAPDTGQRPLTIVYGSQSGTACDLAYELSVSAARYHLSPVQVYSGDEYEKSQLPTEQAVLVFIVSTTGQGEAPDNFRSLYRFLLRRDLPTGSLSSLRTAVFGVGDSSYPLYNAIARRLDVRLQQLGAQMVIDRMLGDEQSELGVDNAFSEWQQQLLERLTTHPDAIYPLEQYGLQVIDENVLLPAVYKVEVVKSAATTSSHPSHLPNIDYKPFGSGGSPYTLQHCAVTENRRLTAADHWQDVRHIEFAVLPSFEYEPGDILLVQPQNDSEMVREFITEVLGMQPDTVISIRRADSADHSFPDSCNLQELLQCHLDVTAVPRRSFCRLLAKFANDSELHQEKLLEWTTPAGAPDFVTYAIKEHRSYLEMLADFSMCRLPLAYLLDAIPRLQPRQFSISSSPLQHKATVHITVALLQYRTPLGRDRVGCLSRYIQQLPLKNEVQIPLSIRRGTFRIPKAAPGASPPPLIVVGPGTGIAPFRSLCWQLFAEQHAHTPIKQAATNGHAHCDQPNHHNHDTQNGNGASTSHAHARPAVDVYFGCRGRHSDLLYAEEWAQLLEAGTIQHFLSAFSRSNSDEQINDITRHNAHLLQSTTISPSSPASANLQADPAPTAAAGQKRHYVQDQLRQHGARVFEQLFEQNGTLMLAGSSGSMPRDVFKALTAIIVQHHPASDSVSVTDEQAEAMLRKLQQQRRYILETYG